MADQIQRMSVQMDEMRRNATGVTPVDADTPLKVYRAFLHRMADRDSADRTETHYVREYERTVINLPPEQALEMLKFKNYVTDLERAYPKAGKKGIRELILSQEVQVCNGAYDEPIMAFLERWVKLQPAPRPQGNGKGGRKKGGGGRQNNGKQQPAPQQSNPGSAKQQAATVLARVTRQTPGGSPP